MKFFRQYLGVWGFLGLLAIWQGAGFLGFLPKFILPTPLEIIEAFGRDWELLLYHAGVSMGVALLGLFLGVLLALVLGFLMDRLTWIRDLLYPLMVVIQTIPTIALAPILVLWLGYGTEPKLVLIVITTVFPILVALLDGFKNADPDILILLDLMQASRAQVLWHYKVPASLPYFFAGLRVSVSYAFVSTVVSEWLGGFSGLGVYMIQSKKLFQYDTMFAIIVLISLISLGGMKLVDLVESRLIFWRKK